MPRPETPLIAVDLIIELTDRPERPIVLIERRNPPHGWALPGGFVDAAYGKRSFNSDAERVSFLFDLYQKYTTLLPAAEKPKRRRNRK